MLAAAAAQAAPPASNAQRQEADRLVLEAKKLSDAGKHDEAIARFRAAEAVLPRALHDCNIGLAYAKLRLPAASLLHLESCRARASERLPDWVDMRIARTREELARSGHAPLDIQSEPSGARVTVSSLGADCPFVAPRRVWVPVGEVEVVATVAGLGEERRRIDVRGEQAVRLELQKPVVADARPSPAPVAATPLVEAPTIAAIEVKQTPPRDTRRARRVAGAILVGVGVAFLVAGMAANLVAALDTKPDAERYPEGNAFQSRLNTFHLERDLAIAGYSVGGAAALAGVATLVSTRF
jgi:hypothetical protein